MRPSRSSLALAAALGLVWAGARAYVWSENASSTAPAPAPASAALDPERQAVLNEMRLRRVVAKDRREWGPEDYTLLLRIREAQAMGAFTLLRSKLGTLQGFALERDRTPGRIPTLWLNREGYEKYVFLRSQDARAYFERKRAEAKFVFELKDLRGRLLFDRDGLLTEAGNSIYNRVQRGMPAFWRFPNGRVTGNVRPGADSVPPAVVAREEIDENKARARIAELVAGGYVEITPAEKALLMQASGRDEEQLKKETSLQVVPARHRVYYLMSPSDPLFSVVSKARSGSGR